MSGELHNGRRRSRKRKRKWLQKPTASSTTTSSSHHLARPRTNVHYRRLLSSLASRPSPSTHELVESESAAVSGSGCDEDVDTQARPKKRRKLHADADSGGGDPSTTTDLRRVIRNVVPFVSQQQQQQSDSSTTHGPFPLEFELSEQWHRFVGEDEEKEEEEEGAPPLSTAPRRPLTVRWDRLSSCVGFWRRCGLATVRRFASSSSAVSSDPFDDHDVDEESGQPPLGPPQIFTFRPWGWRVLAEGELAGWKMGRSWVVNEAATAAAPVLAEDPAVVLGRGLSHLEPDLMRAAMQFVQEEQQQEQQQKQQQQHKQQYCLSLPAISMLQSYADCWFVTSEPELSSSASRIRRMFHNVSSRRLSLAVHLTDHILKCHRMESHLLRKLKMASKQQRLPTPILPRILVIVPFRADCFEIARFVRELLLRVPGGGWTFDAARWEGFEMLFGSELLKTRRQRGRWREELFEGNTDDQFVVGMEVVGGCEVVMMGDESRSDIVFGSVMGLSRMLGIGMDRGDGVDVDDELEEVGFFGGPLDMVVLERAHVVELLQNWERLVEILQKVPGEKQMVVLSEFESVNIENLFVQRGSRPCFGEEEAGSGRWKLKMVPAKFSGLRVSDSRRPYLAKRIMRRVGRRDGGGFGSMHDDRFKYFAEQVFPRLVESPDYHLICVSSMLEIVRLREFFATERVECVALTEHDSPKSFARQLQRNEKNQFVLYTERHFLFNKNVSFSSFGATRILFYSLPKSIHFFRSLLNYSTKIVREVDARATMTCLYSRFDFYRLERLFGTQRARNLLTSDRGVTVFS